MVQKFSIFSKIRKEYFIVMMILSIVTALQYIFSGYKMDKLLQFYQSETVETLRYKIERSTYRTKKLYKTVVKELLKSEDFLSSLEVGDKEGVLQTIEREFKSYKRANRFLTTITVFAPDRKVLVHSSERYKEGSTVPAFKRLVHTAITNQGSLSGFEVCNKSLQYRIVEPIYRDKKFLGVIELGVEIDYFLESIYEEGNRRSALLFLIKEESLQHIRDKSLYFKVGNYYVYGQNSFKIMTQLNIDPESHQKIIDSGGKSFSVNELQINEFYKSRAIGKILFIRDITEVSHLIDKEIYLTILTIFLIVALSSAVFLFIDLKYSKSINRKQRELQETIDLFSQGDSILLKWGCQKGRSSPYSYVSRNVERILGYSHKSILTGTISLDSIKIAEEINPPHQYRGITTRNYMVKRRDGQSIWIYDSTRQIESSDGSSYNLSYLIDITHQKNLENSLQNANSRLENLNRDLKDEVNRKVEEIRQQENALLQQSKLAAMGEMIGAISHQWRQPLNSLAGNIQFLEDDFSENLVNKSYIEDFIGKNMKFINFMSKTIDDFRNFFRADKSRSRYSVRSEIMEIKRIFDSQFRHYSIELVIGSGDFQTFGYPREFQQVVLNLVNNSKDAIVINEIKNGKIEIKFESGDEFGSVVIGDNGGGVPNSIKNRVFEPYFTTKQDSDGTGIGLYMSKIIVEKNSGGSLQLENIGSGASFTIKLPLV